MDLLSLGLSIIVLGWIVQLAYSWKGNKEIQPAFIVIYMLGVFVVAAGTKWDIFQLATLIASLMVFIRIITIKK